MRKLIFISDIVVFFAITMVIVMVSSCKVTHNPDEELVTIDAGKAYNNPARDILLSELVEDIEYIKLETSPDCMIGNVGNNTASEHYLVIIDNVTKRILLFTKDGKYLNDIGSYGEGPTEYMIAAFPEISPDEKHILIRIARSRGIFNMYNIDGSFIKKCIIPIGREGAYGYFGPDKFVSYKQSLEVSKTGGNQLLIYDKELNLTDSLMLSYGDATKVTGKGFVNNRLNIYKGNIYLQQKSNDTIFRIDQTYSITPHLVVDLGGLKIPSQFDSLPGEEFKYHQLFRFNTINNYDLIGFRSGRWAVGLSYKWLVYNRISAEAFFLDVSLDPFREEIGPILSIINDMDGFANPRLPYTRLVDKAIGALNIIDAKTYLESGAVNPKKLVTDKYYNELSKLIAESDIEDNPIIKILHYR